MGRRRVVKRGASAVAVLDAEPCGFLTTAAPTVERAVHIGCVVVLGRHLITSRRLQRETEPARITRDPAQHDGDFIGHCEHDVRGEVRGHDEGWTAVLVPSQPATTLPRTFGLWLIEGLGRVTVPLTRSAR